MALNDFLDQLTRTADYAAEAIPEWQRQKGLVRRQAAADQMAQQRFGLESRRLEQADERNYNLERDKLRQFGLESEIKRGQLAATEAGNATARDRLALEIEKFNSDLEHVAANGKTPEEREKAIELIGRIAASKESANKGRVPPNFTEKIQSDYDRRFNRWSATGQEPDKTPTMKGSFDRYSGMFPQYGLSRDSIAAEVGLSPEDEPGVAMNMGLAGQINQGLRSKRQAPPPNDGSLSPQEYEDYVALWRQKNGQ